MTDIMKLKLELDSLEPKVYKHNICRKILISLQAWQNISNAGKIS